MREMDTALAAEMEAAVLRPVLLCEFLLDSGAIRLWSGVGDLTALGETWTGAGTLLGVSDYQETASLEAQGVTFTLSGITSSVIALALLEDYQGRACGLYLGALDAAGVLVADPVRLFSGLLDTMQITDGGETCTLAVAAENKLVILQRAKEARYTDEDQKARYPDDRGLEFVSGLQDREIVWGRA